MYTVESRRWKFERNQLDVVIAKNRVRGIIGNYYSKCIDLFSYYFVYDYHRKQILLR